MYDRSFAIRPVWLAPAQAQGPSRRGAGYAADTPSLLVSLQSDELFARNANWITRVAAKRLDEVGQGEDADAPQTELGGHFLHGRKAALAALLPVQGERDTHGRGARGADDFHRFADGGAGRDDVIDDDHAAGERAADDVSALAVLLGFLAVECPGHAAMMVLAERCELKFAADYSMPAKNRLLVWSKVS